MNEISFLPYFPREDINRHYGAFHIWTWHKYKKAFFEDSAVFAFLDEYFSVFKNGDGSDLEQRITIVKDSTPSASTDEQFRKVLRFANIVMLSYLAPLPLDPNAGFFASTSDNFIAYHQVFDPQRHNISVDFGSYMLTTWLTGSLEQMKLLTPQYVPEQRYGNNNEKLLEYLIPTCDIQTPEIERLHRSLDWVRLAFSNVPGHIYASRIVAMATAFEILLDLPLAGKSDELSKRVTKLLPPNKMAVSSRPVALPRKTKTVTDNKVGWWCRDFYDLRSRIVHGDQIKLSDFKKDGVDTLKLSLYLFCECVQGMLVQWGLLTGRDRSFLFWFGQQWVDALKINHADVL